MAPPLVSVVLCTYNGADRVLNAISSVLAQETNDLELIVIDDCSTDGVYEIINDVKDSRLIVKALPVNGGVYAARNEGLKLARGSFVAFIDDDDTWLPSKLTSQLRMFESHPHLGLVHCGAEDLMPDGRRLVRLPPKWSNDYRANLVADGIVTSSVVVRRSVFDEVGIFDPTMRSFGDWDMWLRIAAKYPTASVDEPLVCATQREGSIQHGAIDSLTFHRSRVLTKHWSRASKEGLASEVLAYHAYFMASKYLVAGRKKEARSFASQSLRHHLDPRPALVLILTVIPENLRSQAWMLLASIRRRLKV
jgi:glycosyltransferase involved in cell wall biosynthesis